MTLHNGKQLLDYLDILYALLLSKYVMVQKLRRTKDDFPLQTENIQGLSVPCFFSICIYSKKPNIFHLRLMYLFNS